MAPKSKVSKVVSLTVDAGTKAPTSSIGSVLGQAGVNIMEFLKGFADKTKKFEAGTPIPVVITVYENKTFTFVCKTPPASYFLKKYAKITKGSGEPNKKKVGSISLKDLESIAKAKMPDLNVTSLDAAIRIIEGSARSMGIDIH